MRWVGLAFGILCLAGALAVAVRERAAFDAALGALREARPVAVIALILAFALAIPLTAALFAILVRRFARVSFGEMLALIAATSLANMLPLKPGFVGRVAWHRARHGIRPADTLRTVIEAIVLSASVAALMLGAVPLLRAAGAPVALALLAPSLPALGLLAVARRGYGPLAAAALLVRQCEFALSVGRYAIALELVGADASLESAIVLSCASAFATLVPFVSNGLGVREWATALILPALDAGTFAAGVSAEIVLRAAELAVTVPAGLVAGAWLARIARDGREVTATAAHPPPTPPPGS